MASGDADPVYPKTVPPLTSQSRKARGAAEMSESIVEVKGEAEVIPDDV